MGGTLKSVWSSQSSKVSVTLCGLSVTILMSVFRIPYFEFSIYSSLFYLVYLFIWHFKWNVFSALNCDYLQDHLKWNNAGVKEQWNSKISHITAQRRKYCSHFMPHHTINHKSKSRSVQLEIPAMFRFGQVHTHMTALSTWPYSNWPTLLKSTETLSSSFHPL